MSIRNNETAERNKLQLPEAISNLSEVPIDLLLDISNGVCLQNSNEKQVCSVDDNLVTNWINKPTF